MDRIVRNMATLAVVVWAFMSLASCSGSGAPEAKPKAPPKAAPAGSTPAPQKPAGQKDGGADQWVAYGSAADGSPVYYDSRSVERSPDGQTVKFWSKVAPTKTAKIFVEAQNRIKTEGRDPNLLDSFKYLHEVKCASMTYDIPKVALLDSVGKVLSDQAISVRGRKPGPDLRKLMEQLCAGGPAAGEPKKGNPRSAGLACERAGVMVLIEPEEAIKAGAQWRIEGKEWKNSGEAVCNLPVDETTQKGTYKIEYKPLPGAPFITPEPQTATVSAEYRYSYYSAAYMPKPKDQKAK
jgi:hypothetical protein